MSDYTAVRAKHQTLVAAAADKVTLTPPQPDHAAGPDATLMIQNRSTGSDDLYYTLAVGGVPTTAVVAADDTFRLPAGATDTIELQLGGEHADLAVGVSLISAGTPGYSVQVIW